MEDLFFVYLLFKNARVDISYALSRHLIIFPTSLPPVIQLFHLFMMPSIYPAGHSAIHPFIAIGWPSSYPNSNHISPLITYASYHSSMLYTSCLDPFKLSLSPVFYIILSFHQSVAPFQNAVSFNSSSGGWTDG